MDLHQFRLFQFFTIAVLNKCKSCLTCFYYRGSEILNYRNSDLFLLFTTALVKLCKKVGLTFITTAVVRNSKLPQLRFFISFTIAGLKKVTKLGLQNYNNFNFLDSFSTTVLKNFTNETPSILTFSFFLLPW